MELMEQLSEFLVVDARLGPADIPRIVVSK